VTSDHGEALGEHGHLTHTGSVYPEVLGVPLVIAAPGRLPAGLRVASPVGLQQLYATLLALADIEDSEDSLLRLVNGQNTGAAADAVTASAWPKEKWAIEVGGRYARRQNLHREGDRALVWSPDGSAELYDLGRDPEMLDDRAQQDPARLQAMLGRAAEALSHEGTASTELVELDPETRRNLISMGYLDP
jgi:arylsulfatase A-like enzyme